MIASRVCTKRLFMNLGASILRGLFKYFPFRSSGQYLISDDFFDQLSFEEGQAFIASQVRVRQLVLVEAKLVQDGIVDVPKMVGLFNSA